MKAEVNYFRYGIMGTPTGELRQLPVVIPEDRKTPIACILYDLTIAYGF